MINRYMIWLFVAMALLLNAVLVIFFGMPIWVIY